MFINLKTSIAALIMASAVGGITAPASAANLSITLDPGIVAFGYSDGYWDRDHHWHYWHPGEARWYREHYREHYFAHRHDHDRAAGWRDEWWHDHR